MGKKDSIQTIKVALILCSCFFSYGIYWSNWPFDYYLLWANTTEHPEAASRAAFYYANQAEIPNILRYVPIINLCIAATGFATGLSSMTDGNLLFDGASLVLLFFGITTHVTSVRPAIQTISNSINIEDITVSLKSIAAAHFIIVLSITGIVGLQITHYFVIKRSNNKYTEDEEDQEDEDQEDEDQEDEDDEEEVEETDEKK